MYSRFFNLALTRSAWLVLVLAAGALTARGQVVIQPTLNRLANIRDFNGDDLGDVFVRVQSLHPGEIQQDYGEVRSWLPFTPTAAERAAIAASSQITLSITLNSLALPAGSTLGIDIVGVPQLLKRAPLKTDFQIAGSTLISSAFNASTPANTRLTFDVTSFVQNEAAWNANSQIAFRLQANQALANKDRWRELFVIDGASATLNVGPPSGVPEPGTYALLASLGLTGFALWRRRAKQA